MSNGVSLPYRDDVTVSAWVSRAPPGSPNTLFDTPRLTNTFTLTQCRRPSQTSHWLPHSYFHGNAPVTVASYGVYSSRHADRLWPASCPGVVDSAPVEFLSENCGTQRQPGFHFKGATALERHLHMWVLPGGKI